MAKENAARGGNASGREGRSGLRTDVEIPFQLVPVEDNASVPHGEWEREAGLEEERENALEGRGGPPEGWDTKPRQARQVWRQVPMEGPAD